MPAENGEFRKLTEEEIATRMESNLEDTLDTTSEPGDLVTAQIQAESRTLAQNQEEALERVYYAGYLEDAQGKELEKVVDIIGLSRKGATPSTGTVKFQRDTPPTTDYTIPEGATVQTNGQNPFEFVTTQQHQLPYIDGWESGDLSNWVGDTGDFAVLSDSSMTGNNLLEVPDINGSQIQEDGGSYQIGTTFDVDFIPSTGSITDFLFGYQDSSNYHAARIDTSAGELKLLTVEGGSVSNSKTVVESITTGVRSHAEIEWSIYGDNALKVFETEQKDTLVASVFLDQAPLWSDGNVGIRSKDATATTKVDEFTATEVTVNVRSLDEGRDTNLGADSIQVIATDIAGVESVTNEVATGDPDFQNTDLSPFTPGENREEDEELRQRAFDNSNIGGAATLNAVGTKVKQVDGFQSLTHYQNKEDGTVDGMPPHSFEFVIYGGTDKAVAEALFDSSSIDSQDVGGVHGTAASYDVYSDVSEEYETMNWSRPNVLDLDIDLTLIVDDTYVGDQEIKNAVVRYIGGTNYDGEFVSGLDVSEDLYVSILRNRVVDPEETGVWEVDSVTVDKTGGGGDDTTTTANGADVLEVAKSEIAETDATDGSITITTNTK